MLHPDRSRTSAVPAVGTKTTPWMKKLTAKGVSLLAVTATGLAAGFFYTYAISVTRGLSIVPDVVYVSTMQSINATVQNPLFAVTFFGSSVFLGLASVAQSLARRPRSAALFLLAATVFAGGVVGVTFLGNIPLNQHLARVKLDDPQLAAVRTAYESRWNGFNGVRSYAALAAFVTALLAFADRKERE